MKVIFLFISLFLISCKSNQNLPELNSIKDQNILSKEDYFVIKISYFNHDKKNRSDEEFYLVKTDLNHFNTFIETKYSNHGQFIDAFNDNFSKELIYLPSIEYSRLSCKTVTFKGVTKTMDSLMLPSDYKLGADFKLTLNNDRNFLTKKIEYDLNKVVFGFIGISRVKNLNICRYKFPALVYDDCIGLLEGFEIEHPLLINNKQ